MKKTVLLLSFIILGIAIGYYIGFADGFPALVSILVILTGASFGYLLGLALYWKKYGTLIWGCATFLTALAVDWIAGSTVNLVNKLAFASLGVFVGWDFWHLRKQVLLGGLAGSVIGFIWGINDDYWFGNMQLEPGILNASLLSVHFFMFGMALGSLFVQLFDWKEFN